MPESKFEKLKKESEQKERLKNEVISYADFLDKELPPTRWVVEKLIPEGMTILSSPPGKFKTFLILQLCKQISNGEIALNHFDCEKKNILFINEEMGERPMQDRLKIIDGEAGEGLYFTNLSGLKVEDTAVILDICRERNIQLIVFDSLTRIHNLSENDADSVKKIFESLVPLMKEGISVLLTHHHRKAPIIGKQNGSDEMRGSTDLLAQLDCHLAIDNVAKDKSYLVVRQLKLRQAEEISDFRVDIKKENDKISFNYKGEYSKEDEYMIKAEKSRDIVIELISDNPGISKDIIKEMLKGKVSTMAIDKTLPLLEKENVIYVESQKPKKYKIIEDIEGLV